MQLLRVKGEDYDRTVYKCDFIYCVYWQLFVICLPYSFCEFLIIMYVYSSDWILVLDQ